jgi:3-hydroxyacyl-[acyl-carrier-protein] dehydratase
MPVKALRRRGPVWRFEGQAFVGDTLCAEAEFSATIFDGAEGRDDNSSDRAR